MVVWLSQIIQSAMCFVEHARTKFNLFFDFVTAFAEKGGGWRLMVNLSLKMSKCLEKSGARYTVYSYWYIQGCVCKVNVYIFS